MEPQDNVKKLRQRPLREKLSTNTYKKHKPRGKSYYAVNDTTLKGYNLRVYASGGKSYYVKSRIAGVGNAVPVLIADAFVTPQKEARAIATNFLYLMSQGIHPLEERKKLQVEKQIKGITFRELLEEYTNDKDLLPSTGKYYEGLINANASFLWNKPINKITTSDISQIHSKLRADKKYVQAERTLVVIKAVLKYAVDSKDKGITENVCDPVRAKAKPYKPKQVKNHVPITHIEEFLSAFVALSHQDYTGNIGLLTKAKTPIPRNMRDFLLFTLLSGLRLNESGSLQWKHVNFKNHTCYIPSAKGDKQLLIPMSNTTFHMLKWRYDNQREFDNPVKTKQSKKWVFPSKFYNQSEYVTDARAQLKKIEDYADLPYKIRHHDLRRTFATYCTELGMQEVERKALMNHNISDVTEGYSIRRTKLKAQQLNDIEDFINQNSRFSLNLMKVIWYGRSSEWWDGLDASQNPTYNEGDADLYKG